jgi:hypothetical protein
MGCGSRVPVHPAPERREETDELQRQVRSLEGQLASTCSQLADAVKDTKTQVVARTSAHPTPGCVVTEAVGDSTNSAQDAGDARTNLRLRIAADPEEFFAHADTNHDGKISAHEWQTACRGFLGNVDSAQCRALFTEMNLDKDGWLSKDEFFEMRNAIRLFLQGAKCQELLVELLAILVAARWKAGGDDDTSVADKTTEILTELSVDEVSKEVAVVLPRRLKERGDEVRREREERKKKLAELQVEEGEGKFADLPTAAYGDKGDFDKGLEVLGLPRPNTLEELIKECQKKDDSNDDFEAWNSGKNVTNSSKELDFVVDPFDHFEGWQEQDLKDWKPKHQYGGKRIPIRLEVFRHVLSATAGAKIATRFGDYKQAHTLDKSDPRWLHAKEVDMVRVVLCRFIKSQLTGLSLINAVRNAQDVNNPPSLKKANIRAEKLSNPSPRGCTTAATGGIHVHLRLCAADCAGQRGGHGVGAGGASRPLPRPLCFQARQRVRGDCRPRVYWPALRQDERLPAPRQQGVSQGMDRAPQEQHLHQPHLCVQ